MVEYAKPRRSYTATRALRRMAHHRGSEASQRIAYALLGAGRA
jgi:hypothetical protein